MTPPAPDASPPQARGRGEADLPGQVYDREPPVALQRHQDPAVDLVEFMFCSFHPQISILVEKSCKLSPMSAIFARIS
jgi:hypothetical protein